MFLLGFSFFSILNGKCFCHNFRLFIYGFLLPTINSFLFMIMLIQNLSLCFNLLSPWMATILFPFLLPSGQLLIYILLLIPCTPLSKLFTFSPHIYKKSFCLTLFCTCSAKYIMLKTKRRSDLTSKGHDTKILCYNLVFWGWVRVGSFQWLR